MITALAISYNEETHIESYIRRLAFADEIIIVDAYSTDRTADIAKSLGVKVVQREFTNFSDQKNYALSLAKNNWVTFFDLDEMVSEDLANEIIETVNSNPETKAFRVKRDFHFMGKRIKYSGFQTDVAIRLFHKDFCTYNGRLVHEVISTTGKIEKLKHSVKHLTYKSFDNYNEKLSKYSQLQAEELYAKNVRPNFYHFLFRPWYRFMHQYILRLGFLDGKEGFIISYIHGFAVFKRYILLWTKYRHIK